MVYGVACGVKGDPKVECHEVESEVEVYDVVLSVIHGWCTVL